MKLLPTNGMLTKVNGNNNNNHGEGSSSSATVPSSSSTSSSVLPSPTTEVFLPYEHGINEESGLLEYIDSGQTPPILLDVLTARFPSRLDLPDHGQNVDILIRDLRYLSREKKSSLNLNSSEFDSLTRHVRLKSNNSTILKVVRQKVMALNHSNLTRSLHQQNLRSLKQTNNCNPVQINGHASQQERGDRSSLDSSSHPESSSLSPQKKNKKKNSSTSSSATSSSTITGKRKCTKELGTLESLIEEEEAADQIESQVIFNSAPPLCLHPSPLVHLIENKLISSTKLVSSSPSIQRLSRNILLQERRMLKKRQKILSRRQSVSAGGSASSTSSIASSSSMSAGGGGHLESMASAIASEQEEEERLFVASNPSLRLHSFLFRKNRSGTRIPASVRASKSIPYSSLSSPSPWSLEDFNAIPSSASGMSVPSLQSQDHHVHPNPMQTEESIVDTVKISEEIAKLSQKLKAITSMINSRPFNDTSMTKVEEYLMEFETPGSHLTTSSYQSLNPSSVNNASCGGGGVTCVSIFHRPVDDVFFGQLFVDRAPAKVFDNGQINVRDTLSSPSASKSCMFQLGSRDAAKRYLEQFKEILTENGRKAVRITRTSSSVAPPPTSSSVPQTHSQQQQQQGSNQSAPPPPTSVPVDPATRVATVSLNNNVHVSNDNSNNNNARPVHVNNINQPSTLIQALSQQPQQLHHPIVSQHQPQQQQQLNNNVSAMRQQPQQRQIQQPNIQLIQPQGTKVLLPSNIQTIHPQSHQTQMQQIQQQQQHQQIHHQGNIIHIQSQSQLQQQLQQQNQIHIQNQQQPNLNQQQQQQHHQQTTHKIQIQQQQQQISHHQGPQVGQSTVQLQQTPSGQMICTMLNPNTLQAVLQQQQQQHAQNQVQGQTFTVQHHLQPQPTSQSQQQQQPMIQAIQPRQIVSNHHPQAILPQPQRIINQTESQVPQQPTQQQQQQPVQFTQINSSQLRSIPGGHSFLLVNNQAVATSSSNNCQTMLTNNPNQSTGQVAMATSSSGGGGAGSGGHQSISVSAGQSFRPLQVILWPQQQPTAAPAQQQQQPQNIQLQSHPQGIMTTNSNSINGGQIQTMQGNSVPPGSAIAIANINLANVSVNNNTGNTISPGIANVHVQHHHPHHQQPIAIQPTQQQT